LLTIYFSSLLFFIIYTDNFINFSYVTIFISVANRGSSKENTELSGAEVVDNALKRVGMTARRTAAVI